MRVWYDTEFLDDGHTVMPISIGMVDEQGRELYAVNSNMLTLRVLEHEWLRANVWPKLPVIQLPGTEHWVLNHDHPDVKPPSTIRDQVHAFLKRAQVDDDGKVPALWAHIPAYDHVVLAQLWGPLSRKPSCMPWTTRDLDQLREHLDLAEEDLPPQPPDVHHALADARWARQADYLLRSKAAARTAVA